MEREERGKELGRGVMFVNVMIFDYCLFKNVSVIAQLDAVQWLLHVSLGMCYAKYMFCLDTHYRINAKDMTHSETGYSIAIY